MGDNQELTEGAVLRIMEGYGNEPQQLIAILLDIQAASGKNYVDRGWAELVSRVLNLPLSKIYDVLTFYAMFSTTPRGEYLIEICQSAPCQFGSSVKADQVVSWFEAAARIKVGQTDGKITLARTSCVGACETGPVAKIGDEVFGDLDEEKVRELVKGCREGNLRISKNSISQRHIEPSVRDTKIINRIDGSCLVSSAQQQETGHPADVSGYVKVGGFDALKKAIGMGSEDIIAEVKKAKLLGRGGAAYPAGNKWEHLLHIPETPKYIVCNADEGEPGTFKDRLILDKLPLKLLEGIIIAGFTFKAKAGYIYVRGEYRKIQKRLLEAIANAREAGFLGRNILGTGFDFDIEVVSGAGAYVCGENSALLNSTEGKVGRPRIKPPHLAEVGLFLQPTLVNNVEALANIPGLVGMGGDEYLKIGHPDSGGTKLICISGQVQNRGVFEIPLGKLTLRDIIFDPELGGGITDRNTLKFFHLGGQSGPIGGPDLLDTVYSYTDLRKADLSVGSGAIVVMDQTVSIIDYLICVTEFFIHESCGKCIPCREGNRQLLKLLKKLAIPDAASTGDLQTLRRLIRTMTDASFCGLGQTATAALNSAWKHFKAEFEANVRNNNESP
jgi:NADH-quinone oxidoreductase subunit F